MENKTFSYNYSASRNKEVEAIRKKYMPKEESKLEKLKRLDGRVQGAGVIEALCIGVLGALIFGIGMCLFLGVFTGSPWLTAILMVSGLLLMIPAYPIYKQISYKTRNALTPEILQLSEEILKAGN